MTLKKQIHLLTNILLLSTPALATVNVREGAYLHSADDFDGREIHDSLHFERLYNSRSSHSGLFGFGWCTRFESKIRRINDDRVVLFSCGAADEIRFRPNSEAGGVTREWRAENAPGERLLFAGDPPRGRWMRPTARGEIESYESETGRLVGITDRAGRVLRVIYDASGRLKLLETSTLSVRLSHETESGRVAAIETADGSRRTHYHYEGSDLTQVSGPQQEWGYRYDDYHNMTALIRNGQVEETIDYESALDRVLKVRRASDSQCEQEFVYQTAPDIVQDHLIAKARTRCREELISEKRFDFWYERTSGSPRLRSLSRMKVTERGESRSPSKKPATRDLR